MRVGGYLGLGALALCLLIVTITSSASAQAPVEAAFIRGQFSNGNGNWNAGNFGWFYYDVDKDVGGETLSVNLDGRLAEKGHIVYSSHTWQSPFEYKPWGSYNAIALLGKRYLAGYPENSFTKEVLALGKGELRQILIDNNDTHTLTYNDTLPLLGGYSLALNEISHGNDVADLFLFKNQKPVNRSVVNIGDTFVFKVRDVPVILVHLSRAMRGEDSGAVQVDGIFQVSDTSIVLNEGAKIGNMELIDLSGNSIEFRSSKDLSLTRNSIVPLLYGLELIVLDEPELIYYPQGSISEYGVQVIRGPVYTQNSTLPARNPLTGAGPLKAWWSFENFSGLYFDPDNILGGETLFIENISGRNIPPPNRVVNNGTVKEQPPGLWYISNIQSAEFKFMPWGRYSFVSFLGQPWFAGYGPETSSEIGNVNILKQFRLAQLIDDSDKILNLSAGKNLTLGEGYELALVSVKEDKAFVQLNQNGKLIESSILKANSTYIYKKDVAEVKDLPIIAVHVQNVITDGKNEDMVIDGFFQISDRGFLPVDSGREFGDLVIIGSNSELIAAVNLQDNIKLSRDTSVSIWPGMNIRIADNDTLRYFPYTLQYVVPAPKILNEIGYDKNVQSLGNANFSVVVQAGDIVSVTSEILDPTGRAVNFKDLTRFGKGYEDIWGFFWTWNATVLRMSDDGSPVLDASGSSVRGLLYLNKSSRPLQVGVTFDSAGRIAGIADSKVIYYVSPTGYNLTKQTNMTQSYSEMLANSTARRGFIKIEPGSSLLSLSSNHTLTGPIESLEPHAIRIGAPPGRYELRVRVQNAVNAIRASGIYFNVTGSDASVGPAVSLGSSKVTAGGNASIPLNVYPPGEKRIEIHYDPAVLNATGVSGPCNASSEIDRSAGNISVIMPAGCSSTNLMFAANNVNATSSLNITKVEGFRPDKVINGSVTVLSQGGKSDAPAFAVALAALVIVALARRRG